ncbi:MptD family putative ECF transporter S component [Stomatohabitans albus]|uniref:MptD family putative ECF transporter S component n=1 Tax=Stomatohabitans albus TaxID=3110766 RepID=UPI00300D5FE7
MATRYFNPKYLVHVGVFSAIYIVVFLTTAALGIFGPPFLFLGWAIGTVLNGTVLMLFRLRAPCFGAMTLLGLLEGLIAVGSGYPWYVAPLTALLGAGADAIAQRGGFTNRTLNMIGYGVFAPWIALPFLPILVNSQAYFDMLYAKARNKAFVAQLEHYLNGTTVILWMGTLVLVGLVGAWLGNRIIAKHFVKAGLVDT